MAGWNINDHTHVVEEFDISVPLPDGVSEPQTKYQSHQYSDYVLLGKDGKPSPLLKLRNQLSMLTLGKNKPNNTALTSKPNMVY